jgi:hypothetical protein
VRRVCSIDHRPVGSSGANTHASTNHSEPLMSSQDAADSPPVSRVQESPRYVEEIFYCRPKLPREIRYWEQSYERILVFEKTTLALKSWTVPF